MRNLTLRGSGRTSLLPSPIVALSCKGSSTLIIAFPLTGTAAYKYDRNKRQSLASHRGKYISFSCCRVESKRQNSPGEVFGDQLMNISASIIKILSLVSACLIAIQPDALTAAPPNSGRLLVSRAAKFGDRLALILSVDGKHVASVTKDQRYDASLPAGKHVLIAQVSPNKVGVHPARETLIVEAGRTYSYTAALSGQNLVLVKK
jgi:hypothetical protein